MAMGNNYKNNGGKIYNAGIYIRLSREDEEHGAVSQSIINQKDFLSAYAAENGFNIVDCYIDDGFSGVNFDRPNWKRLIEDIEKGIVNTVITKDLSRLGRDYIMTGHYIEKYFPLNNIRYIAVNDGVDTDAEDSGDMTAFKAVINDMYARDISKKTRTAKTTQKLKGEFIGSVAPYGYKKSGENKKKLVIDDISAVIVRRIYKMYLENMSMSGIAKQLSFELIPTPSALKNLAARQRGVYKGLWNTAALKRILTNPTYIGHLTQNRSKKVSYKINKQNLIPRENWITVPNTHEAIISEDDFNAAQKLMSRNNYSRVKRKGEHLLSGLVFCGDCKKPMTFCAVSRKNANVYLVCSTRKRYGRLNRCTPKNIRESLLEDFVLDKIKETARKYLNKDDLTANADNYNIGCADLNKEMSGINRRLDEVQIILMNLYKDKVKNIITEQNFISLSKEFDNQRDILKERLNQITGEIKIRENQNNIKSAGKYLDDFLRFENADRLTLVTLIDRIEVYRDKTIVLKFDFLEP